MRMKPYKCFSRLVFPVAVAAGLVAAAGPGIGISRAAPEEEIPSVTARGSGVSVRDETLPVIRLNTTAIGEGNSGTVDVVLTATLSAASTDTVSVDYATVDGTATAGSDYIAKTGTLVFTPGQTTQQITLKVNGNIRYEPDEAFTIKLSNPSNSRLDTIPVLPQVFNPANGHWYRLVTKPETWETANVKSAALNLYGVQGHQVTMTSEIEKDFLVGHFAAYSYYLGSVQIQGSEEPAAGWIWITDEPFIYTNWNTGEPNDVNGGEIEDVLYASSSAVSPSQAGRWNDTPRYNLLPYVVEFDTPASAGLADRPGTIVITNDDPGPLPASVFTLDYPATYHLTSLPRIEGTVQDYASGGGIVKVKFYLLRQSDNAFWNGTSWNVNAETFQTTELSGAGPLLTWKRTTGLPVPGPEPATQLQNGSYLISAIAENADGQKSYLSKGYVFDGTPPQPIIDNPADGTALK